MFADVVPSVAAIASAIAAVIAVRVAYRSVELSDKALAAQEKHNRLALKPIPFVALADFEHQLRIKVVNDGAGPLVVRKITVSNDFGQKADVISWMPPLPPGLCWSSFSILRAGRAILPNNGVILLQLDGDPGDEAFVVFRNVCRRVLAGLTVQVEYTDIYEGDFEAFERSMDWFARTKGTRAALASPNPLEE
jgi:hypothetical protein